MRLILKIIFMTTLCFSTVFSRSGDGREIIKAYERGKPAKMDIEITKVKSDNYIEMVIDRSNKKIYKDITEYAPENRDMQKKLYVTDYIKKMDKSMRETLPYRVVSHGEKRYLEIDYSGIAEPREIYLWVVEGKKVEKLYTGIMEREYFDPNNPLSYIDMDKTGVIEGDNEKIVEEKGHRVKIKVGEIRLAELSKRGLTDTDIYLALKDDYRVFSENMKELKDIDLFFSNNEKNIVLNKTNNTVEIMGEIDKRDIVDKKIYVSTKGSNVNEFQVEVGKPSKARILEDHYISFQDYFVDLLAEDDGYDEVVWKIKINNHYESTLESAGFTLTFRNGGLNDKLLTGTEGKFTYTESNKFPVMQNFPNDFRDMKVKFDPVDPNPGSKEYFKVTGQTEDTLEIKFKGNHSFFMERNNCVIDVSKDTVNKKKYLIKVEFEKNRGAFIFSKDFKLDFGVISTGDIDKIIDLPEEEKNQIIVLVGDAETYQLEIINNGEKVKSIKPGSGIEAFDKILTNERKNTLTSTIIITAPTESDKPSRGDIYKVDGKLRVVKNSDSGIYKGSFKVGITTGTGTRGGRF